MMERALTCKNSIPWYSPVPTWRVIAVSSGKSVPSESASASFHRKPVCLAGPVIGSNVANVCSIFYGFRGIPGYPAETREHQ